MNAFSVGLPKVEGVFKDSNVETLLNGVQMISNIPTEFQQAMLDKNITRLVVLFSDVVSGKIQNRIISCSVTLHQDTRLFMYNQEVIVFI